MCKLKRNTSNLARVWISLQVILIFLIGNCLTVTDTEINYDENRLYVSCFDEAITTVEPRPIVTLKAVKFTDCPPPSSYAAALEALYVNVSAVQELHLSYDDSVFAKHNGKPFKGLNIRSLIITWMPSEIDGNLVLCEDFWMYFTNLTNLYLIQVDLPPLPVDTNLEIVELYSVKMTEWGGCSKLQELSLYEMDISGLSRGWLAQCQNLSTLHMTFMKPMNDQILERSFKGLTSLVNLNVTWSQLVALPKELNEFSGWTHLQHLDFSYNNFQDFSLKHLPSLIHLDLSGNKIEYLEDILSILDKQPTLRRLSLHGNKKLDMCSFDWLAFRFHANLEKLTLSETATNNLCFTHLQNLEYVDMRGTKIFKMTSSKSGHRRGKVKLLASIKVECDCDNAWLSRALHENLVSVTDATCTDGTELQKVSLEQLECDRGNCDNTAIRNCTCRKRWHEGALDVDCRGADIYVMPQEKNLRSVIAPNSHISNLTAKNFPDSLLRVDLSNNRLPGIDPITLETIFNVTSRRVRLAGNPFICDCDHRLFIETLQKHKEQVEDLEYMKCFGSNKTLSTVNSTALCVAPLRTPDSRTWLVTLPVAGGILVSVLALAAALFYRYEYQVKMLLFAHGCLFCVREDDLDADRPYDVFLSFSHGDVDFVLDELLPGLEDGPQGYKVCIHFRDWVVGDWIPAQITRSVELSRRTVIVLSEHFLASVWGILEFRTAHEIAVTEGRRRIVVVALDDAVNNDERLDSELRTYLRNNTYLRWGDKWFWSKLRYALPHRHSDEVQPEQDPAERVGIQLRVIKNCSNQH